MKRRYWTAPEEPISGPLTKAQVTSRRDRLARAVRIVHQRHDHPEVHPNPFNDDIPERGEE